MLQYTKSGAQDDYYDNIIFTFALFVNKLLFETYFAIQMFSPKFEKQINSLQGNQKK